jgi:GNAT superfamily N-acetyltransferase
MYPILMAGKFPIKIRIRVVSNRLSRHELGRLARIAAHYFPDDFDVETMLLQHLGRDSCVQVAEQNDEIIGISITSCERSKTPFCKNYIPLFYQRILYVDPDARGRAVGLRLQVAGLRYQMGAFWMFRRFAVICLTNSPKILRAFNQYSEYFPCQDHPVPEKVYEFCRQLGSIMGFERIDRQLLVYGTNESNLAGVDYTTKWERFLKSGHASYDRMILNSVFSMEDGRILHAGVLQLVVGYAGTMHFVLRFLKAKFKYHI